MNSIVTLKCGSEVTKGH